MYGDKEIKCAKKRAKFSFYIARTQQMMSKRGGKSKKY